MTFIKKLLSFLIILALLFSQVNLISFAASPSLQLKRDLQTNGIYLRADNAVNGQTLIIAQYSKSGVLKWISTSVVDNVEGYAVNSEIATSYEPDDMFKGFLWDSMNSMNPISASCSMSAKDVEEPALWLDAADQSTVILENGKVKQWKDKSTNGRDVVQDSEANRPSYTAGSYIQTNGIDSAPTYLESDNTFIAKSLQPITIFMVAELDSVKNSSAHYLAEGSLDSNIPAYNLYSKSSAGDGGIILRNSKTNNFGFPTGYWSTGNQLHVIVDTKESMKSTVYRNDNTIEFPLTTYTNLFPSYTSSPINVFSIGARKCYDGDRVVAEYAAPCKFKEIIVYQKELSEKESLEIQEYLTNKWGINPAAPKLLTADTLAAVAIEQPETNDTQNAYYYIPNDGFDTSKPPIPLVVGLHSWSANYANSSKATYATLAEQRGWAMIHPNFEGPNNNPDACASEKAVNDIVSAVEFMKEHANIDPNRIYLVGASGGGHMALSVASRRPDIWAAVSAWVPITDLAEWYSFSKSQGSKYYRDIVNCTGGVPGESAEVDAEYYLRSPRNFIQNAVNIPLDLNTGIHDGHTGSVPVSQTLYAFNKLADAYNQPEKKLTEEEISTMVDTQTIPQGIVNEPVDNAAEGRALPVLFRRSLGISRVSVFDGSHTMEATAAFKWLDGKSK